MKIVYLETMPGSKKIEETSNQIMLYTHYPLYLEKIKFENKNSCN